MSLFDSPAPRLFALPSGADFADAFAHGLRARFGAQPPEAMARVTVMVNTRRGQRAIEDALMEAAHRSAHGSARGSALLPRLSLLSELGEGPLAAPALPPSIDPMRRQLRLTRLVEAYLRWAEGGAEGAPVEFRNVRLKQLGDGV